jgi:tetratricopeptide (TPR) repeat protein
MAERYVALARQKHGEEHTEFATAISWLAFVYDAQGRYAEAASLYKRALLITEKAFGPNHADFHRRFYWAPHFELRDTNVGRTALPRIISSSASAAPPK